MMSKNSGDQHTLLDCCCLTSVLEWSYNGDMHCLEQTPLHFVGNPPPFPGLL